MANRRLSARASRTIFFGLVGLGFSCGGRTSGSSSAGGTDGDPSMVGTRASAGAAGTLSHGGSSTSAGSAGQTGQGASMAAGGAAGAGASGFAGVGGVDWAACDPQDTCLLLPQTFCGIGCEPVPLSRYIPVNAKYEAEFYGQQIIPPCLEPACPSLPPGAANSPNYFAVCATGHCQGFDVRKTPLSACSSDAECVLRSGTSCCGCGCDQDNLIAVSSKANAEAVFCGASGACSLDCEGCPLTTAMPYCSSGRCLVKYPDLISGGGAAP